MPPLPARPRFSARSLGERVNALGHVEVALGQSAFAMSRKPQGDFVVANIHVRMVLFLFRDFRDRIDEIHRLREVVELESPLDRFFLMVPFWNFFEGELDFSSIEE